MTKISDGRFVFVDLMRLDLVTRRPDRAQSLLTCQFDVNLHFLHRGRLSMRFEREAILEHAIVGVQNLCVLELDFLGAVCRYREDASADSFVIGVLQKSGIDHPTYDFLVLLSGFLRFQYPAFNRLTIDMQRERTECGVVRQREKVGSRKILVGVIGECLSDICLRHLVVDIDLDLLGLQMQSK